MCTRYYIEPENADLLPYVDLAGRTFIARHFLELGDVMKHEGEIRPSDVAPVIATGRSRRKGVFPMKWGYTMAGASGVKPSLLLNARSETAAEKKTFAEGWKMHRCIIPASWYFEWAHYTDADGKARTGDKFMIQPEGAQTTWLCGLYRMERGLPHFVVLTREPSGSVAHIHDRMPLMLPEHIVDAWIDPSTDPDTLLPYALTNMILASA